MRPLAVRCEFVGERKKPSFENVSKQRATRQERMLIEYSGNTTIPKTENRHLRPNFWLHLLAVYKFRCLQVHDAKIEQICIHPTHLHT